MILYRTGQNKLIRQALISAIWLLSEIVGQLVIGDGV